MPMIVYQAGGFLGSTAGDAGAIVGSNWVAAVDLGQVRAGVTAPATRVRTFLNGRLNNVHPFMVITHYHDDHGNPAGARAALVGDFANGLLCEFPNSNRAAATGNRQGVTGAVANVTTYAKANGYVQSISGNVQRPNGGGATDVLVAIPHSMDAVAAQGQGDAQENKYSGAVYAELRDGPRPRFGFLSLGDMDRASSDNGINQVFTDFFGAQRYYPEVLVIKLPHHASAGNWSDPLGDLISHASNTVQYAQRNVANNVNTRVYVLASGHTGNAVNGYDGMRRAIDAGARGGFILVADHEDSRVAIGQGMRAMWQNQGLPGKIRLLDRARINAADNGVVTLTGQPWRFRYRQNLDHDIVQGQDTDFDLSGGNDPPLAGDGPLA